jgi:hypothetical protein
MQPNLSIYYWSYPIIMLTATFWMAWLLRCKIAVVLSGISRNAGKLEERVNGLLVIGLLMVNLGYLALTVKTETRFNTIMQVVDMESIKVGFGLILLGLVYTFDIFVYAMMRSRTDLSHLKTAEGSMSSKE